MMAPDSMHKCFQLALRLEEKDRRRHDSQQRGRGNRGFRVGVTLEEEKAQVG